MTNEENYQETLCDWVGKIPKHWNMTRGRFLFNSKKEINRELQCKNLLSLTLSGVLNKDYQSTEGLRPENYNTYQIFQKDDLVFKMIDLENVNTSRVGLVHEEGIMSPVYIRHEPIKEKINPKFAYWFYYDLYKKEIYNSIGSGVRSSLSSSDLLEIELPVPPITEQKLISRYLDKKTSQIDLLIEKVQKKIDLLNEQRTSLINHYVTKGLDTNVEMKDSGVEWIGEIPKHWNFTRNKNFLKLSKNIVGEDWAKFTLLSLGRSGITVRDLESGKGKFPESFETYQTVKRGQFVFCLFDIEETPRTVGLSNEDGMITGAYTVFDCSNNVSAEFIYYYYLTIDEFKGLAPHYSGLRKTIRPTKFLKLGMFLPSLQEQIEIVEQINRITQDIDKFIDLEANRKLVLNEYKQSLISSVVTGKVKVSEDMI